VTRLVYGTSPKNGLLILSHGLSFVFMAVVAVTIVIQVFRAHENNRRCYCRCGLRLSGYRTCVVVFYYFLQVIAPSSIMAIAAANRGSPGTRSTRTVSLLGNCVFQHVRCEHHGIFEHGASYPARSPIGNCRSDHGSVVCCGPYRANRCAEHC
jgi:hypothetical protein